MFCDLSKGQAAHVLEQRTFGLERAFSIVTYRKAGHHFGIEALIYWKAGLFLFFSNSVFICISLITNETCHFPTG